jgi:hypothetical protein
MKKNRSERGQALILIAFGIIVLVGFTALAVDGGMTLSDRRQAQNAADSAALAGALAKVRLEGQWQTKALATAATNGYNNDGTTNTVAVYNPPINGSYANNIEYIQVIITSNVDAAFAPVIGVDQTTNVVQAVARAKPPSPGVLFDGNAVVGLHPSGLSFDSWGESEWYISGGGVFANYDARKKNNKDNVHFLTGECVTVVHGALYFNCPHQYAPQYVYPDDIIPLLPRIPACNGVAYRGADGKLHPQAGKDGSQVDHFEDNYAPGLYCITDAGGNIHGTVTGTGVTFYISDTSFTMKYNGHGAMAVQAPTTGEYADVLMFSNITPTPCTQNIHFRGNGSADNVGTIFLPSACIDARGNSEPHNNRTQIIGYQVTANGTGDVYVSYHPDDNYKKPQPPAVELVE